MSERLSLADELKESTESEAAVEERVDGDCRSVAAAAALEPLALRTEPDSGTARDEDPADTGRDDIEAVLLDNDPLVRYLHDSRQPQPAHIVSAPVRPAGEVDPLTASAEDGPHASEAANTTSRWHPRQGCDALHTLLSVLCPALLSLVPPSALSHDWQPAAPDSTDAYRQRFHYHCRQLQRLQSSEHAVPMPPPHRASDVTAAALRLSVWLQASAVSVALLALLIAVGRSMHDVSHSGVALASCTLLAAFFTWNWMAAKSNFRLLDCWRSSAASLVSVSSLQAVSSRLAHRSIRRISEVELVARGYLLSDNVAPAVRLDQSQPHNRRSTHIRRTLQHVLSTAMRDHEKAQRALMVGHRHEHAVLSHKDDDCVLSISELKERTEMLGRMYSTTLSLLISTSAAPCSLPAAEAVEAVLSLLVASTRQLHHALDTLIDVWQTHKTSAGSLLAIPPSQTHADCVPAPPSLLRQLSHQLRSAEARSVLAAEQSQLDDAVSLSSHVDYIRRAAQDVQRLCDELTKQLPAQTQPAPPPPNPHTPHSQAPQDDQPADAPSGQSALLSELRRARRRGQLADGQGAVFEGEGLWREKGVEDGDEDEGGDESGQERLERRRRMAQKRAGVTQSAGMSQFAANLSMVRELKSVLSHRPALHFASVQADGDGADAT